MMTSRLDGPTSSSSSNKIDNAFQPSNGIESQERSSEVGDRIGSGHQDKVAGSASAPPTHHQLGHYIATLGNPPYSKTGKRRGRGRGRRRGARQGGHNNDEEEGESDHDTATLDNRLYRGHRRSSFREADIDELVELRARQRTFDGAYTRTALGNFGYALIILKVFNPEFAKIGLIYVILACLILLISVRRGKRSEHDFADRYRPRDQTHSPTTPIPNTPTSTSVFPPPPPSSVQVERSQSESNEATPLSLSSSTDENVKRLSPPTAFPVPLVLNEANTTTVTPLIGHERIWGRPFRTSGDVVILLGSVVTILYITLFIMIMKLN